MTRGRNARAARRLATACLVVVVVAGCGGGSTAQRHTVSAVQQKRFAELRIVYDTNLDYLDPALSYTSNGWQAMWRSYVGLLTYKEVAGPDGAAIVPGLAQDLPRISPDAKDYTFMLRKGLEYSNGKPVKAGDFKYAIKRLFLIDSPGIGFFTDIVGTDKFAQTKKGDIAGIVVDDAARTIEFKLAQPRGDFENILATVFAAPVPPGTPAKDQSTHPIPATGPYMLTSYRPNRSFTLARNPRFRPTSYISAGNPDRISFDIVADDTVALQRVINGQADYDFHQVPFDRIGSVNSKYGDRLKTVSAPSTFYFFMNTLTPPFDKVEVRRAVNHAIDRNALARLYGGLATPTETRPATDVPVVSQAHALSTRPRQGQAADRAGGRSRCSRHGLELLGRTGATACRIPRRRAEQDRPQSGPEDHQRLDLLHDDRESSDEGPDRVPPGGARTTRIPSTGSTCC